MFDIAVSRMKGHGRPAHQVWLPPLDVPNSMDQLLGDLAPHPELGLVSTGWRERGRIVSREHGERVLQLAWQPPRLG